MSDAGRPLRVCIATPSFPPDFGGLGEHVGHLSLGLSKVGCQVTVVTQTPPLRHAPTSTTRAEPLEFHLERFPARLGGRRFAFAPGLARWVRDHETQFDLVHAFSFHAPVALSLVRRVQRPFFFSPVLHPGGHSSLANAVHLVYDLKARQIFARSRVIFCTTSAERDALLEKYPFCAPWTVVQGIAVDWDSFDAVEPFDEPRPVILSAGRLETYKGVDRVIKAMAMLDEEAELVICGEGPDEGRLRTLAAQSSARKRVRILGWLSGEELRRWQRTAQVVVSLSTHESFGLSLAEGAAAGARIVASDIAAHRDMARTMDVDTSWVSADESAEGLAVILRRVLALGRDSARQGRHRTWLDVATDTLARYHEGMASSHHIRGSTYL
jgi:glycosyltransferase involved in cell wall biosynthesis